MPNLHELVFEPAGRIGWGGNGGFHALNIVCQFGAKKIILVGYDMTLREGSHWHGKHGDGLNNPRQGNVDRWRATLDAQAPTLAKRGIEVVIGSPGSALTAYRKLDLLEALDEFHRSLFGSPFVGAAAV